MLGNNQNRHYPLNVPSSARPASIKLEPIRPGDIVEVIAPASKSTRAQLAADLRALKAIGLVPRVSRQIFGPSFLFANTDKHRLAQLQRALYAPDSSLIWCVRGGYGSIRLLPAVEKWRRPTRPKILLGYSDITTLHVFLNQRWRWPSLHGPLLDRLGRNALSARDRKELLALLYGRQKEVLFTGLRALNASAARARNVRGPVLGGNMAVLQSGLGTRSGLRPARGTLLFFEDIGERPHRVDRMLTQFAQAGWFERAGAVILGDFRLENEADRRRLWSDVFARFAREVKIPVVAGVPVGHDPRRSCTLPFNTAATLSLGRRPQLLVASGIRAFA